DLLAENMPAAALQPVAATPVTPDDGPASSYHIDSDVNEDADGDGVPEGLSRNQAGYAGDIEIFQRCETVEYADYTPPDLGIPPPPPPVHLREMTHARFASPMHNVVRSWHERDW